MFLFIFSLFVLSSHVSQTAQCAEHEKEKFYIKKVLFSDTVKEGFEDSLSFVIGCKGEISCPSREPLYLILITHKKDIIPYDKIVLTLPKEYGSDVFGSIKLKGYGTIPLLAITKKENIKAIPPFIKLITTLFMEYGADAIAIINEMEK